MNAVAITLLTLGKHEEIQRVAKANRYAYLDDEMDIPEVEAPKGKSIFQRIFQGLQRQNAQEPCA